MVGGWSSAAIGDWRLAVGDRLLAIGCRRLAIVGLGDRILESRYADFTLLTLFILLTGAFSYFCPKQIRLRS